MKKLLASGSALLFVVALLMQSTARADEKKEPGKKPLSKNVNVNGELTDKDDKDKKRTDSYSKSYTYKMHEGATYTIEMKSKDMDSFLRLENPGGEEVAADDDGGGFPDAKIVFKAEKSGNYKIICTSFRANETGNFVLTVVEEGAPKEKEKEKDKEKDKVKDKENKKEKGLAKNVNLNGEITDKDPNDKKRTDSFCKTFTYKMVEGRTYVIEMKSKDMDSFLRVENGAGEEVAFDDDGGGFPDAKIEYKAPKTGDVTIICTTYNANETGKFVLTVREEGGEKNKDDKAPDREVQPVRPLPPVNPGVIDRNVVVPMPVAIARVRVIDAR